LFLSVFARKAGVAFHHACLVFNSAQLGQIF